MTNYILRLNQTNNSLSTPPRNLWEGLRNGFSEQLMGLSVGLHTTEKKTNPEDQQPELWMRCLLMIVGRVEKHLVGTCSSMSSDCKEKRSQSSKSTSGPKFILLVTVWKIRRFSRRDGRGNSIFRSRRPGRSNAGSSVSARFVAMITCGTESQWRNLASFHFTGWGTHLDIASLVETIHLIEEFKQDSLNFTISTCLCIETLCRDSVDFVDKND